MSGEPDTYDVAVRDALLKNHTDILTEAIVLLASHTKSLEGTTAILQAQVVLNSAMNLRLQRLEARRHWWQR